MSSPQPEGRVITLVRPLKNVTVTAGETATFQCELSYEDISVDWFLGGTKLEPSDRVSLITSDTPVCSFPDTLTFSPGVQTRRQLWSRSRSLCSSSLSVSLWVAPACSYKVLQVEVQGSSLAFDPGFQITQARSLFCPASVSVGLFLTARGRSRRQVGSVDIR